MSLPENSALKDKILNPEETERSDGEVLKVTFQLEVLGVIQGLQHQVVNLTSTVDTLVATVKTLSNKARDLSTNVAASAAKTTPQVTILQRPQTKSYAEAVAQPPKTPAKGRKRSATQGPTPPKNPKQKQTKEARAPEDTSAIPAKGNNENATVSRPKNTTIAKRRIYATWATPAQLPEASKLETKISTAITKELQKCGCSAPTNLQIQINPTNGTVSLTTAPGTEAAEYMNYLAPMTTALSATLPEAARDYKEFKRAPTDTQVVIHGISLEATSNEAGSLYTVMKESLFLGQQVNISSARFLKKDSKIRETKRYTSMVVSLPTDDVEKITPAVLVFGRHKSSAVRWHSNPTKQCWKCYLYGHPEEGCKTTKHTCPICAGEHRLKEYKCASPTCPKKGDKKIVANCGPITPSKCIACGRNHPAYAAECPIKIKAKADAKAHYDRRRPSRTPEDMDTTK